MPLDTTQQDLVDVNQVLTPILQEFPENHALSAERGEVENLNSVDVNPVREERSTTNVSSADVNSGMIARNISIAVNAEYVYETGKSDRLHADSVKQLDISKKASLNADKINVKIRDDFYEAQSGDPVLHARQRMAAFGLFGVLRLWLR